MEIFGSVQKQVHAGNGRSGQIFLLPEQLAKERLHIAVMLFHILDGFEQHAACTAGRIVDSFAFLRRKHPNHEAHHRSGRVKFTRFLVGRIGKLLDEILIRLAQHVYLCFLVAHWQFRKMLHQIAQKRIR